MDIMYQPGVSFLNPQIQYSPVEARKFSMIQYKGKQRVKKYGPFPALWRRSAKSRSMQKLGLRNRSEMASFGDVGLGQTTVTTQPKQVERNFWGSLVSLVTTGADVAIKREETKTAAIRADIATREATSRATYTTGVTSNLPLILGLGGGALLITMLMLRKKK